MLSIQIPLFVVAVVVCVTYGQANYDSLGCNHYLGQYVPDFCYVLGEENFYKYVCSADFTMAIYWYDDSPDCSDTPTGTTSYTDSNYFQCDATTSCEFAVIEDYDIGNDCDESSRDFGWQEYLIDTCVSDGFGSYQASCNSTSITVNSYDTDNCTGTYTTKYVESSNYTDSGFQGRTYCSTHGGYGPCDSGIKIQFSYMIFVACGLIVLFFR